MGADWGRWSFAEKMEDPCEDQARESKGVRRIKDRNCCNAEQRGSLCSWRRVRERKSNKR